MERKVQCLLGNGSCSETCKLYNKAKQITNALGDDFDPQVSRQMIFFADAFSRGINVTDITRTVSMCESETKKNTLQPEEE